MVFFPTVSPPRPYTPPYPLPYAQLALLHIYLLTYGIVLRCLQGGIPTTLAKILCKECYEFSRLYFLIYVPSGFQKYFLEPITMLFVVCLFLSTEKAHSTKNIVSNYKSGISSFFKFPPCAFIMNK